MAGDIATTRGRKGGIRIATAPDTINLVSIIRRTEANMELVPCFGDADIVRSGMSVGCGRYWRKLSNHFWRCSTSIRWPILFRLTAGWPVALGIKALSPPAPGSSIEPVL
jgi:hypothetical protein